MSNTVNVQLNNLNMKMHCKVDNKPKMYIQYTNSVTFANCLSISYDNTYLLTYSMEQSPS